MTIDLKGSEILSAEDLKSRAMTRLAAQGLGLAERLANIERAVYALRGEYTPSAVDEAQIKAIGAMLLAEEAVYLQEKSNTALLAETISYEAAQARIALPTLVVGSEVTQEMVDADTAERAAQQAIIDQAGAAVVELAADRAAARAGVMP